MIGLFKKLKLLVEYLIKDILSNIYNNYILPFNTDLLNFYYFFIKQYRMYQEYLGELSLNKIINSLSIFIEFFCFYYFLCFLIYMLFYLFYTYISEDFKKKIISKILKMSALSYLINFLDLNINNKQIIIYSNSKFSNYNTLKNKICIFLILLLEFVLVVFPFFFIINYIYLDSITIEKIFLVHLLYLYLLRMFVNLIKSNQISSFVYNFLSIYKFPNIIIKIMFFGLSMLCSFNFAISLFLKILFYINIFIFTFFLCMIRVDWFIYYMFMKFFLSFYIVKFHNPYIKDTVWWKKIEAFYKKHEFDILVSLALIFTILRPFILPSVSY